jgi:hypothetical protein
LPPAGAGIAKVTAQGDHRHGGSTALIGWWED